MEQVLEDEAERQRRADRSNSFAGATITDYSVWEVAQLLRLPGFQGRNVVIAAECPMFGKQASSLESAPSCAPSTSSPRGACLPDIQVGIGAGRIERQNVTRCSNSSKGKPSTGRGQPPVP